MLKSMEDVLDVKKYFEDEITLFHEHLDSCEQCRNHPFELCFEGANLLEACRHVGGIEEVLDSIDEETLPRQIQGAINFYIPLIMSMINIPSFVELNLLDAQEESSTDSEGKEVANMEEPMEPETLDPKAGSINAVKLVFLTIVSNFFKLSQQMIAFIKTWPGLAEEIANTSGYIGDLVLYLYLRIVIGFLFPDSEMRGEKVGDVAELAFLGLDLTLSEEMKTMLRALPGQCDTIRRETDVIADYVFTIWITWVISKLLPSE